ncbi:MAG: alkaline phosphatase D family protein [Aquihabitans sp.]
MTPGDHDRRLTLPAIGRRQFLTGAAAAAALVAVGCSSDDGGSPATSTTSVPVTAPDPVHAPHLSADPFTLGVASGDPTTDSVILWTRLAPDPLAEDASSGMPDEDADVVWELAVDDRFSTLLAAGVFTTNPAHAHSAHVDVTGLEPGTSYAYRFRYGDWTSPVGQTQTLPDGSPERFAIAVVNCQMFESGRYGAYANLIDEDVDLVMHLGDYIYEYPFGEGDRKPMPDRWLTELTDYRLRYSSYRTDVHLQAAHARFPFILTWDDHEVANNYMGDVLPGGNDPEKARARKQMAYQAWWENLPVRLEPPENGSLTIYQDLAVGDLARIHLLDERQYSDEPPCRDVTDALSDYGDCEAREGEDRSRLGADQEAWLASSLAKGGVTWNILGNPVVLAGVNGGTDEDAYYLDVWDGFPQARKRLIDQLAEVSNPVVLTGDYHAGMVLDVHDIPFDTTTDVVAPEFMAPPISSILFPADVSARTPQLRQQLNEHGYLTVEITPERLTTAFRCVADVQDADTAIETLATWQVDAGDPVARPI